MTACRSNSWLLYTDEQRRWPIETPRDSETHAAIGPSGSIFANRDGLDLASRGNPATQLMLSYHDKAANFKVRTTDPEPPPLFRRNGSFRRPACLKDFRRHSLSQQSNSYRMIYDPDIVRNLFVRGFAQIRIAYCMGKQYHAVEILEVIRWQLADCGPTTEDLFWGAVGWIKKIFELAQIIPPLGALVIISTPRTPPKHPTSTMACVASTFTGSVAALKASKVQVRVARSPSAPLAPVLPPVAL